MDFLEKCTAAGLGSGAYEGYPVVNGRVFKKVDGKLKAFTKREDPKPWEDPLIEDKLFDSSILKKIEDIEAGTTTNLSVAEIQAIADAEKDEADRTAMPDSLTMWKKIQALEAVVNP